MNKAQLIETLANKTQVSKKDAETLVDALVSTIVEEIKRGGEVTLTSFGTFSARVRKGREGVNPRTKGSIVIPPVKVVKFKAGKMLKEQLKASQQTSPIPTPPDVAPTPDLSNPA